MSRKGGAGLAGLQSFSPGKKQRRSPRKKQSLEKLLWQQHAQGENMVVEAPTKEPS